jgi:hypothetical protein
MALYRMLPCPRIGFGLLAVVAIVADYGEWTWTNSGNNVGQVH